MGFNKLFQTEYIRTNHTNIVIFKAVNDAYPWKQWHKCITSFEKGIFSQFNFRDLCWQNAQNKLLETSTFQNFRGRYAPRSTTRTTTQSCSSSALVEILGVLLVNSLVMINLPLPEEEPDFLLLFFNAAANSASFPVGFSGVLWLPSGLGDICRILGSGEWSSFDT